jgi:hypothetical protein
MTLLPSMAFAAAIVYWLYRYVSNWFSPNATSVVLLFLFVIIFVATNTFLKNLRDG